MPSTFPKGRFEVVFHLASLITHRGDHTHDDLVAVNVGGTRSLLSAYPDAHFVFASTMDVLRPTLSEYATTKRDAERAVLERGNSAVVRLPSVFGPNQRQTSKLIPKLLRHYVRGESAVELSDEARPLIYVDDAAKALLEAASGPGTTQVQGTAVHNRDLDRLIRLAAANTPIEAVAPGERRLYGQLLACAEALRAAS